MFPARRSPFGNGSFLKGTSTNDNAAVGVIGEYVSASLASGSATGLTSVTGKSIISASLTAGDWDVVGIVDFVFGASTNVVLLTAGISIVDNSLGADDTFSSVVNPATGLVYGATYKDRLNAPMQRISIASTTPVYLVALCDFSVSTLSAHGQIRARRVR